MRGTTWIYKSRTVTSNDFTTGVTAHNFAGTNASGYNATDGTLVFDGVDDYLDLGMAGGFRYNKCNGLFMGSICEDQFLYC